VEISHVNFGGFALEDALFLLKEQLHHAVVFKKK